MKLKGIAHGPGRRRRRNIQRAMYTQGKTTATNEVVGAYKHTPCKYDAPTNMKPLLGQEFARGTSVVLGASSFGPRPPDPTTSRPRTCYTPNQAEDTHFILVQRDS